MVDWWDNWIEFWATLPTARDSNDDFFVPLSRRHAFCPVCGTL